MVLNVYVPLYPAVDLAQQPRRLTLPPNLTKCFESAIDV